MHNHINRNEDVKGPHLDPRRPTILLLTVVLLQVLWFLPTIPLLGGGMPHDLAKVKNSEIERVTEMHIKKGRVIISTSERSIS